MKIDTKSFVKQVQAHTILIGHCFMWNGDIYMRIRDISEVDRNRKGQIMSVNMESGQVAYFSASALVLQIDNIEAVCTDKENDNENKS